MTDFTNDTTAHSEKRYIEIKPKQPSWLKPKPEIEAKPPISSPLLHDFITSLFHHYHNDVFATFYNIPKLSNSKLLKQCVIDKSYQEYIVNQKTDQFKRPYNSAKADAVWELRTVSNPNSPGFNNTLYNEIIIHEIKTGKYSLQDTFSRYMKCHMSESDIANANDRCDAFRKQVGITKPSDYLGEYDRCIINGRSVIIRLYIWAWKKHIDSQPILELDARDINDRRIAKKIKMGRLKQIELEYVLPLVKAKLMKLANNLEGDL